MTATFNGSSQQLMADVDREKAETLGVPVQDVYDAMQTMFGSLYVSQFIKSSRLWQVILQAEPGYRLRPEELGRLYVRDKDNVMLPLSSGARGAQTSRHGFARHWRAAQHTGFRFAAHRPVGSIMRGRKAGCAIVDTPAQ